ncbi:hypothetical protein RFF05_02360 [Bengtsoniella intestinalis]|uniref:hypothetical protein n=1 Tax=Bengtsoniella intestinalis TaxID=3073143 RepID=UPI00391EEE0B
MKRPVLRTLLLIAYWVPFAFLAMYGDRELNTLWLYGFMVVDMAILCWACMKNHCPEIIIGGNLITVVSSYLCLQQMLATEQGEYWVAYFKPLTPIQLVLLLTGVMVVLQLLWMHIFKIRHQKTQPKQGTHATKPVRKTHKKRK